MPYFFYTNYFQLLLGIRSFQKLEFKIQLFFPFQKKNPQIEIID